MNGQSGIEWFPMETNAFTDDEKIFDLMDGRSPEEGYALFGRYMALVCRVYRSGPVLEVDGRGMRKLARDLGLDVEGLEGFLDALMDAGLVDRGLWEREGVITSRGIQRRWCAGKKRTSLYAGQERYSLLDAEAQGAPRGQARRPGSSEISANSALARNSSENSANSALARSSSENSALDKRREEEIRKEEKREDEKDSPSSSERNDGFAQASCDRSRCPGCLTQAKPGNGVYLDADGGPHRTAYGALEARYRSATGRRDFAELMAAVADLCPGGCRASPEEVSECHALMAKALDKCDGKGRPTALVRKILSEDRGANG